MKRVVLLLAAAVSVSSAAPLASQSISNATSTATIPANPKDVASADAIIAALYDANTILVDRKKDADRFRSLFVPGARLMPTAGMTGRGMITIQTVDDYVRLAGGGQPRHGFSEREIARTSQAFGNIMQVFSTYEARRDSADTRPTRGINSLQLFNDGSRWWVVGVLWDNERPDKPMPSEFLKSGKSSP
ncbi:MAG TPA: hypothetical protein VIP11_02740 [Gemmatimonadaceae bacterium]